MREKIHNALLVGAAIAARLLAAGSISILDWLQLGLDIYKTQVAGLTTTTADEKIAGEVQAAITEYRKVHGTEVTAVQLESLRTEKLWPDVPSAATVVEPPTPIDTNG